MKEKYLVNARIIDPKNKIDEIGGLIIDTKGLIKAIGKKVAKNEEAYRYLQESIDQFPSQEELLANLTQIGFYRTKYLNMFNGIVSIHIAYKI